MRWDRREPADALTGDALGTAVQQGREADWAGDLAHTWHLARLVGALSLSAGSIGLGVVWGWTEGIAAGLAILAVVPDAAWRLKRPGAALHSLLIDLAALGIAAMIAQPPAVVVGLPFAYAATTALLFETRHTAVRLIGYAALWTAAAAVLPALQDGPAWRAAQILTLAIPSYIAFAGFLLALLQANARTLNRLEKASRGARAAARAKSDFLRNMSHEVRTPMNGILGMAELMLDSDLSEEHRDYAQVIHSSGRSLLALINDLLDLSWIEAGKIEIERAPFKVRDTLADIFEHHRPKADAKGLRLDLYVASATPEVLVGDPGRFRQIVTTLVSNAVKFTHEGYVWVRVGIDSVDAGRVVVHTEVQDTGIGIAPHAQDNIFGAFSQADGSLTREHGGSGAGLAIASRLAGLMGGAIWVDSVPGRGSTFHFTGEFGTEVRPAPARVEARPLESLSAVVVADTGTSLDKLDAVLSDLGIQSLKVPTLGDALTALSRARNENEPFALAIVDVREGLGAAQRLSETGHLAGTKLVLLTPQGQRGDAARARELNLAAYLTKPIDRSSLAEAIRLVAAKPAGADGELVTKHSVRELRQIKRVLVAEDSPTNRLIVQKLLERHGYEVDSAEDGFDAVEAWSRGRYDIVLMDIQMPRMDGLEATQEIRRREQGRGEHIPIVALTAHALRGDRERCIGAGMDEYLTKPLRIQELLAILGSAGEVHEGPSTESPPVFNSETALELFGNDRELLAGILEAFLKDCPGQLAEIAQGVDDRNAKAVQRHAHKLKGELGNLGADAAYLAASELDRVARLGRWDQIEEAWSVLEREMRRLEPTLQDVAAS